MTRGSGCSRSCSPIPRAATTRSSFARSWSAPTKRERPTWWIDARSHPTATCPALAALQQLVATHRESKNTNRHLLALADLYAKLTVEYVDAHPPESLDFDPPRFEELVEAAARLYEAIGNQDGAPEKLEASRRLEAFLAFTLQVDRDRFSP